MYICLHRYSNLHFPSMLSKKSSTHWSLEVSCRCRCRQTVHKGRSLYDNCNDHEYNYDISSVGWYLWTRCIELLQWETSNISIETYITEGPGWLNELGSWIYLTTHTSLSPIRRGFAPGFVNYKKGCNGLAAASDKVYQLLAYGRWFSPASSTTKTGRHDIAEILLKMALNTKNQSIYQFLYDNCNDHDYMTFVQWIGISEHAASSYSNEKPQASQ
jgi:hypothetical protein